MATNGKRSKAKSSKRSKGERSKTVARKAAKPQRGNMLEAIRFIHKRGKPTTIPDVSAHFERNDSTVDNWLRGAAHKGYLRQSQPGDMEGKLEHAGRPPTTFDLTASGRKWLENPQLPRRGRKPGTKVATKAAPKAKRKAAPVKAKAAKVARKPSKPDKPKAGQVIGPKAAKAEEKAKRDAAAKRAKRAQAKVAKTTPAPAPVESASA